ncbi:MAG: transcription elongation factor Spt5 [Candidatus Thalassarchaeum betae]|uniref:Transcription elongation factor Spt5 n=1 Tax=Candidatus Thalassarchaeum betae TaxID=2599289 RepID=A0A2V3HTP0_9ARCH|nr:MAG: transcription elongation factor Spt5 [Candidatus Thalassoarchaea betae]PXF27222.1 MAG: transcription elongation factor Spt5 [Euryarchaeota archaeon]HIC50575.1 transcription elongation factor Spt5 [Candidatus Poseidoniales archaeon]HIM13110.1 transcription elongation factor Spt5 [Candidatus Poseidoniales archaeon]HIM92837.1 transcription elongation factor Spt5 [Candidatus Poseidoniales archaeon]
MSDAFTVFIRNGERVLLMQRADGVADFPGAWDGIYGVGDPEDADAVTARITEVTGIDAENLEFVRSGEARGLAFGNRLNEVTPVLFASSAEEVDPRGLYTAFEWVDPGSIQDKKYATPQLREMYGDVASFLYILKTSIGQEQNVAKEIRARLSGTGSLKEIQDQIFGVLSPHFMRGYIFVEASALHHVEKLIGRVGVSTTPMKNCRKVLDGESPLGDVLPYLEPKAATAGIEEGCIVEIHGGAFRGQAARVTRVTESKEEVTVELFEAAVPVALTVRADQVRVTQRVE